MSDLMHLDELKKYYEMVNLDNRDSLLIFYVKLRRYCEKYKNPLRLTVISAYTDFFVHAIIDRNPICRDFFNSVIKLDLNSPGGAALHKIIIEVFKFTAFQNDMKILLEAFYPNKVWDRNELSLDITKFLLSTLRVLSDTEFYVEHEKEVFVFQPIKKLQGAIASSEWSKEFPVYPKKLRIDANMDEFKSAYEIEFNNHLKIVTKILHTT